MQTDKVIWQRRHTNCKRVWIQLCIWIFVCNNFSFAFFIAVEELITLVENVADSVSIGQCNPDSMSVLLSNLRMLGPQLEEYSKSTLDQGMIPSIYQFIKVIIRILTISFCCLPFTTRNFVRLAYVKFRNASQDERLSIITRMNLLELIELRAKNWHVSDGINTYYKHKVSDVQVNIAGPKTIFACLKKRPNVGISFDLARAEHRDSIDCVARHNSNVRHLPLVYNVYRTTERTKSRRNHSNIGQIWEANQDSWQKLLERRSGDP